jgi:hypothetical protein
VSGFHEVHSGAASRGLSHPPTAGTAGQALFALSTASGADRAEVGDGSLGALPKVPPADALSLLLLALDQQPWRFEKAAPRWHARLCDEAQLTLPEAQLALAALHAFAGPGAVGGGQALVAVCSAHGLDDAVGVLDGWLDSHD